MCGYSTQPFYHMACSQTMPYPTSVFGFNREIATASLRATVSLCQSGSHLPATAAVISDESPAKIPDATATPGTVAISRAVTGDFSFTRADSNKSIPSARRNLPRVRLSCSPMPDNFCSLKTFSISERSTNSISFCADRAGSTDLLKPRFQRR